MDGCFGYRELKALEELISASQGNSDPEDDLPQAGARKIGPGDIGAKNAISGEHLGPHAPLKGEAGDIWHPSEAVAVQNSEVYDPRIVPEYEMKFKQAVTAEDVFLGVSVA
ncbi:dynein axonemal assembly factor 6 [Andrena cerasifolii]|uniref:dynein axonemal assembly factor 6 n=1 Tax=Andrena cerasifolii TaxID=2819439 RepID=UPI0040378274